MNDRINVFVPLPTLLAGALFLLLPACARAQSKTEEGQVTAKNFSYHGWTNCMLLSNGRVEVIIVPAIGRVMQFRFVGDEDGPFWENRALDGKAPDPDAKDWINFGGDKSWPSPQKDWPKVAQRAWPPPRAFDSMPDTIDRKMITSLTGGKLLVAPSVILQSAIDPHYGIRVTRQLALLRNGTSLVIKTTFAKLKGDPVSVGVWVVTQLRDPVTAFMPAPPNSIFKQGYDLESKEAPPTIKVANGLVSLARDPVTAHKIGNDASSLLWVGEKHVVKIDCRRIPDGDYPHNGSGVEIYTNPDPLAYVELETHGPRRTMKVGDEISSSNTYTLLRRTEPTPEAEARKYLAP